MTEGAADVGRIRGSGNNNERLCSVCSRQAARTQHRLATIHNQACRTHSWGIKQRPSGCGVVGFEM